MTPDMFVLAALFIIVITAVVISASGNGTP